MPLEQANYIHELVESNPVGSTDLVSEGDDHLRLIKKAVKGTFPQVKGAVSASHTELSYLKDTTGVTGTGKLVRDTGPTIEGLAATGNVTIKGVNPDDYARLSRANDFTNALTIKRSTTRFFFLVRSDAPEDNQASVVTIDANGTLHLRLASDDQSSVGPSWATFSRDGLTRDAITFNAATITLNGALNVSGKISGDGSGLTGLNASSLASGTVAGDRLGGNQTMAGNKVFSDNVTVGGIARKGSAGGFAYHASANNLGGRITISSSEATTAAQVGDPGDMRFVYL